MTKHFAWAALSLVLLTGCATSRNYQPDIDALNAKVDSLQSQLQAKNKEVAALSDQVRSLQGQLESAKRDKMDAEQRLKAATSKPRASGYDKQSSSSSADKYAK